MQGMDKDAARIIDGLGGTIAAARLCEVTPQAVSQWREDGVPHARLMFLKLARPDLFEEAAAEDEATQ